MARRWSMAGIAALLCGAMMLTGYAPAIAAPPCVDQGGFAINGDFVPGSCAPSDWSTVNHAFTTTSGTYKVTADRSIPAGWSGGGGTPPKVDFTAVYTYAHVDQGHYYLDLAWERQQTSGTGGYVIEMTNAGVRMGNGVPQPDRSNGGAVFYITTQGSSAPRLLQTCVYRNTLDYPGACTTNTSGFVGAVNTSTIATRTGKVSAGGFFEVGLDVTALSNGAIVPGCPAASSVSAYLRSFTGKDFGPTGNLKGWASPASVTPPSTCGSLDIVKHDSHGQALAGAVFTVTPDPTTGTGSRTVTTDASGRFRFPDNAKPGTYTVTETKAPAGYLLADPASRTVTVGVRQSATVTFVDPLGQVRWSKVDQNQAALAGATFRITATSGPAAAAPWNLDANPITVTDNAGRDLDPAGGAFRVEDLPVGTYQVKEIAAPAGYRLDGSSQAFTIDEAHPQVVLSTSFVNTMVTHTVTLQKTWVDGVLGDSALLQINGDAGATSTVTAGHTTGSWTDKANVVTEPNIRLGSTVTLSEQITTAGKYARTLTCADTDGNPFPITGNSFSMPDKDLICTYTNTAGQTKLTLIKNVDHSAFVGAAQPSDWTLSATGRTTGKTLSGTSGVSATVTPDTYSLGEVATDMSWRTMGYTQTSLVCVWAGTGRQQTLTGTDTLMLAAGDDVTCTFTNAPTPAKWTINKTSDKGLSVMPGDTIHYTVTVTHDSTTSWPASVSLPNLDDLSPVAAHATLVPGSLSASAGTPTIVGNELSWTADLTDTPASGAFTISYAFTVDPGAWGVDLPNALTPPKDYTCVDTHGTPDPAGCTTDSQTPDVLLWKTSVVTEKGDPAKPAEVFPGGQIRYTLHAMNDSAAFLPAGQTVTDDVSGIVQHATIGSLPTGLTYDGARTLTWTLPALAAGKTATISFTVTVTVASDGGGYRLTNVVVPETIGHCPQDGDESGRSCRTDNDTPQMGDLMVTKTVDGNASGDVATGTVFDVRYTYTVNGVAHTGILAVPAGGAAMLTGVPAGTVVTLTELTPSQIKGDTWATPTYSGAGVVLDTAGAHVTIVGASTVLVGVVNTVTQETPSPLPRVSG